VLLPLFWKRVRVRDALAGAVVLGLLYLPFLGGPGLPVGAMPNVVEKIRFNGPIYLAIAWLSFPAAAAGVAVLAGLAVAAWSRWRLAITDPAAWAWPMAAALLCAPVVYSWYLLYLTPFLVTVATLPLLVWSFTVFGTYLVWYVPAYRLPWDVPIWVLALEYGIVLTVGLVMWRRRRQRT
jgi:alpha-1,6-mannosyltransferase